MRGSGSPLTVSIDAAPSLRLGSGCRPPRVRLRPGSHSPRSWLRSCSRLRTCPDGAGRSPARANPVRQLDSTPADLARRVRAGRADTPPARSSVASPATSSWSRADTRHELLEPERFEHVVVGAALEPRHGRVDPVARGQDDDRQPIRRGARTRRRTFATIEPGQPGRSRMSKVEIGVACDLGGLDPVGNGRRREPVGPETLRRNATICTSSSAIRMRVMGRASGGGSSGMTRLNVDPRPGMLAELGPTAVGNGDGVDDGRAPARSFAHARQLRRVPVRRRWKMVRCCSSGAIPVPSSRTSGGRTPSTEAPSSITDPVLV